MKLQKQIENFQSEILNTIKYIKESQKRNYGDINIDIKVRILPNEKAISEHPELNENDYNNIFNSLSNLYLDEYTSYIENKTGFKISIEGRSGGWFVIHNIYNELDSIYNYVNELTNYIDYYEKYGLKLLNRYKKHYNNILKNINWTIKTVNEALKKFKKEFSNYKNMKKNINNYLKGEL